MIRAVRQKVANVPTPLAGLALGIASVMWSWENFGDFHGRIQFIGAVIGAILLVILLIKFVLHPKKLGHDLAHPVVGSVVPTYAMTLMVVSATINKYSVKLAALIWFVAVVLHLLFLVCFILYRIKDFSLSDMVPSWFVPPIGIIVAVVAVPTVSWLLPIAKFLQYFGMVAYAVMLPTMLYRFIFSPTVSDMAKPTIAIMAAPASLCLAGYLTVIQTPSILLVGLLTGIAILMTMLVYLAFFHLMRLPFSASYSAFTFPMAIGATALFKLEHFLLQLGISYHYIMQIRCLANIELWIASLVIGYVAILYVWHYLLPTIDE